MTTDGPFPPDPERARRIRDEQVQRAAARLDDRDALTPERRAELERLGDRLVARLLVQLSDGSADGGTETDGGPLQDPAGDRPVQSLSD